MTVGDLWVLAPYVIVTAGILVHLLAVSFWRTPGVSLWTAVAVLVAGVVGLAVEAPEPSEILTGFMVVDGLTTFFNGLALVAALATAVFARTYLAGRSGEAEEFYILLVVATLGAMTMGAANHFAALLLGLEILSVSLYVLIGYPEEGHPPLEAALKYLVLSGVASTTMLFGIALVYMELGTLRFDAIGDPAGWSAITVLGHAMMIAGIAFKLSLAPFHMWTPDVYQGAPAPVTGYLATVSKGAMVIVITRYAVSTDLFSSDSAFNILLVLAVLSMIGGNVLALLQTNIKRLLAYSSIAHVGYLMIALAALARIASPDVAVETVLMYLAAYFAMSLAAFGAVSILSSSEASRDADHIDDLEGLFWRQPLASVVLTVSMLALAGIPLTMGFMAKFYVITTGVEGALWLLVWSLVIGSAIAIYYYLRVVIVMTRPAKEMVYPQNDAASLELTALTALGVTIMVFGIYPTPLITLVRTLLGLA